MIDSMAGHAHLGNGRRGVAGGEGGRDLAARAGDGVTLNGGGGLAPNGGHGLACNGNGAAINPLLGRNGRPSAPLFTWSMARGSARKAEILLAAEVAATVMLNVGPLALATHELARLGLS